MKDFSQKYHQRESKMNRIPKIKHFYVSCPSINFVSPLLLFLSRPISFKHPVYPAIYMRNKYVNVWNRSDKCVPIPDAESRRLWKVTLPSTAWKLPVIFSLIKWKKKKKKKKKERKEKKTPASRGPPYSVKDSWRFSARKSGTDRPFSR